MVIDVVDVEFKDTFVRAGVTLESTFVDVIPETEITKESKH